MYHLGVPTTRALSVRIKSRNELKGRVFKLTYSDAYGQVIGTGAMVPRAWYNCDGPVFSNAKFPPNAMGLEPGAVACRVSRSFLRFGQMELFARRNELNELLQLADFICFREFPHLLDESVSESAIMITRHDRVKRTTLCYVLTIRVKI